MPPTNTSNNNQTSIDKKQDESIKATKEALLQSVIDLGASSNKVEAIKKSMGEETSKQNMTETPKEEALTKAPNINTEVKSEDFTSYDKYQKERELLRIFEDIDNKERSSVENLDPNDIDHKVFKGELEKFLVENGKSWASETDKKAELWIWEKFGKFKKTEAKDSSDAKIHIEFEKPDKNPYWGNATLAKEHASILMSAEKDTPGYMIGKELLVLQADIRRKIGLDINPEPNDNADVYVHRLMHKLQEHKKSMLSQPENKPKQEAITEIHGIKIKDWNDAMDYMFRERGITFDAFNKHEKESRLQQIFGYNKVEIQYIESIGKPSKVIKMDYFRDLPEWQIIEKIPAKYFFNFKNVKLSDGKILLQADIDTLFKAGILKDEIVVSDKEITHNYSLTRKNELEEIQKIYQPNSPVSEPYDYENIEQYIERVTKDAQKDNNFNY